VKSPQVKIHAKPAGEQPASKPAGPAPSTAHCLRCTVKEAFALPMMFTGTDSCRMTPSIPDTVG
jgi:hypothetical protein